MDQSIFIVTPVEICYLRQRMKYYFLFLLTLILYSCTKEIKIDIPNFEEQLVVDGTIEVGGAPIVILSKSADIYDTTELAAYLLSFVDDANVKVISGQDTCQLTLMQPTELTIPSQKKLAEMLSIDWQEILLLPIKVYSNNTLVGAVQKTYTLDIDYHSKHYSGETYLPLPTPLDDLYWKIEEGAIEYGFSWATLSDPGNQYDAYKWEVKRINKTISGEDLDAVFKRVNGAYFDDAFFNGITFSFYYNNPLKRKDTTHLKIYKRYYRLGDSVVVKFSKIDQAVYHFFNLKEAQMSTASNPFASPINVATNMKGGALGVWAGFSPWFDTLYCIP